ncbi:hypothetical protein AVEN_258499-1 [Araneus ventricosus]|uniref:Uncharacterized protein n=1 Tax=Araneus ventricosus TaxID=182803 RepID=A0A4Y2H877_ARAVE|nr:hypothetical protein AVEN_258499-1 [Araneus ventricosus]
MENQKLLRQMLLFRVIWLTEPIKVIDKIFFGEMDGWGLIRQWGLLENKKINQGVREGKKVGKPRSSSYGFSVIADRPTDIIPKMVSSDRGPKCGNSSKPPSRIF